MVLLWMGLGAVLPGRSDGHSGMECFNKSFIKISHFADTQIYKYYIKKYL